MKELFNKEGYINLPGFLNKDSCKELADVLKSLVENKLAIKDNQCPLSESVYGSIIFEKLLLDLLPTFENICGKKLYPTYSYARLYSPNDELTPHIDRPSCEISVTITLDFEGDSWPIFMTNLETNEASKITMDIGDAILYQGISVKHWREKYTQGKQQAQVFLHYVDADGLYASHKFDKREKLNLKEDIVDFQQWIYTDILTEDACNKIIATYDRDFIPKLPPTIGDGVGSVDTNIRNVERIILPIHKDIGGRLAAAGFDANRQAWKFNITHANQAEFLKYPAGGRYVTHVDTFMNPNEECRKLTVLTFLNDDFKGGKFYFINGPEKYYPHQKKGTVLVFPSFIPHGVEDITEGIRYSVVCWLVGPFFK